MKNAHVRGHPVTCAPLRVGGGVGGKGGWVEILIRFEWDCQLADWGIVCRCGGWRTRSKRGASGTHLPRRVGPPPPPPPPPPANVNGEREREGVGGWGVGRGARALLPIDNDIVGILVTCCDPAFDNTWGLNPRRPFLSSSSPCFYLSRLRMAANSDGGRVGVGWEGGGTGKVLFFCRDL